MPPPSRKRRKEVENPPFPTSLQNSADNFQEESEIISDEHLGDPYINISTTGDGRNKAREPTIRLERDPQLDRRARKEKGELEITEESCGYFPPLSKTSRKRNTPRQTRGTSSNAQALSSSSPSSACFICTRATDWNFTSNKQQTPRSYLMRVNMFKDAAQEVLGNSYSMSPSSETCEECDKIMEQVWDLQHEILLIKEELRKIIMEAMNHGGRKDLAKDNLGHIERGRRLGFQDLDNENGDNYFPNVIGSPVEMPKEEPISDFEDNTDACQDYENVSSFFQLELGEERPNKESSTTRKKRKSRIKAELILLANKNEDGQLESSDEEYSEFGVAGDEDIEVSDIEENSNNIKFESGTNLNPKSKRKSSPVVTADPKSLRCDICDINLSTSKLKRDHIRRIHENQRPFPCTLCDKRFFTGTDLKRHRLSKHGEENAKYKCQKCGKQLPMKNRLLHHEIAVCKIDHGEEFYKKHGITFLFCVVEGCPAKFRTKRERERHIAAHTGRKDFICSRCGTSFTQSGALKKHEREVDCTIDGYKARNYKQSRLKRNHPCTLCPLKCVTLEGLAHHQKTVHDIDPPPGVDLVEEHIATCDVCGITVDKDGLKRHIERVHKNIKNKSCPYCDKMFYNNSGVNKHIKVHHQEADLIAQAESILREHDDLQP